jgi:methionyl-tRNA synthetase
LKIRRVVASACVLAIALACSEPPTKEHDQADGALAAARAAEAATYAPDELHAAEDALAKYDQAVADRDYRQALGHAVEARDSAYAAARRAGNEKAAARSKAERLDAELSTLMKTAAARLAGSLSPRITGPAADRLRTRMRSAPATLQEARSLMTKQNYLEAIQRLEPVVEGLQKDLAPPNAGRRGRSS